MPPRVRERYRRLKSISVDLYDDSIRSRVTASLGDAEAYERAGVEDGWPAGSEPGYLLDGGGAVRLGPDRCGRDHGRGDGSGARRRARSHGHRDESRPTARSSS